MANLAVKPSSTTQSMKHQQPQSTTPGATSAISTLATTTSVHSEMTTTAELSTSPSTIEMSSQGSSATTYDDLTEAARHVETSIASVPTSGDHEESPEVNEETAEANYATPETNHESPEPVQETQEPNQEVPEVSEEDKTSTTENFFSETPEVGSSSTDNGASPQPSTQVTIAKAPDDSKRKEPTIDSVVDEIYVIVKPTISPLVEHSDVTDESKVAIEKIENIEDELEETR